MATEPTDAVRDATAEIERLYAKQLFYALRDYALELARKEARTRYAIEHNRRLAEVNRQNWIESQQENARLKAERNQLLSVGEALIKEHDRLKAEVESLKALETDTPCEDADD